MTSRATFKQADVERACKGVAAAGLKVALVRLAKDGAIEIVTGPPTDDDKEDWRSGSPLYRKVA